MNDTPPPPPPRSGAGGCFLALSILFNVLLVGLLFVGCLGTFALNRVQSQLGTTSLTEQVISGDETARDKVAVLRLDGLLAEGLLGYVHRQIDQAARDEHVKAVVLRVNSPGGTITSSDDLYRRLALLRDGNPATKSDAKPHLVASFASIAASGGYYVAMPAKSVFAERTTLTGSIGVYAAFPDVHGLAEQWKVGMTVIKQGDIKDSGSPFKEMSAREKQVWQDMVDHAYTQFLQVVEDGRPQLKGKLLDRLQIQPVRIPGKDAVAEPYTRYRADGGIWTADKALEYGLIDAVGPLDAAVAKAREMAGLGDNVKVVQYERPRSLADSLLGLQAPTGERGSLPGTTLDWGAALTPRVWYLAPGYEAAAAAALTRREEGR